MAEVIQADREAAASLVVPNGRWPGFPADFLSGRADANELTQLLARHRTEAVKPLLDGTGFVFWNPDSGEEYSPQHPVESGECGDAEHIRPATAQEETLGQAFQEQFQRAEALATTPPSSGDAVREALAEFIYETTHLSPMEDDGSHWCKISAETLRKGREALNTTQTEGEGRGHG